MNRQKLAEVRLALGLSANEVARRADLSQAQYSRIESGLAKSPGFEIMWRICRVLGIKLDDLADDMTGPAFAGDAAIRALAKETVDGVADRLQLFLSDPGVVRVLEALNAVPEDQRAELRERIAAALRREPTRPES